MFSNGLTKAQKRNIRRSNRRKQKRKEKEKEQKTPINMTLVLCKTPLFTNPRTNESCISIRPPYMKNGVCKHLLKPVILYKGIVWKPPCMLSNNEINISSFTQEIDESEMQQKYELNQEHRYVDIRNIKQMNIETWRRYIAETGGSYYEKMQNI